jgi:hypothetical protein
MSWFRTSEGYYNQSPYSSVISLFHINLAVKHFDSQYQLQLQGNTPHQFFLEKGKCTSSMYDLLPMFKKMQQYLG